MISPRIRHLLSVLGTLAVAALVAAGARAETYTITTLEDDELDNGNCTLREALLAAANDSTFGECAGDPDPDTIVLDATGTYPLGGTAPILGFRTLAVRGDGDHPASDYVVDLGDTRRFLEADFGATLTVENLTLTRGDSSTQGGALLATNSDLTLRRVTISESQAQDGGGVAFFSSGAQTLDLAECTFLNNAGVADQTRGGGLYVDLQNGGLAKIVATSFLGNHLQATTGSFGRQGGGLYIQGYGSSSLVLHALRFEENRIDGPSFTIGAGAYLYLSGTGSLLFEDALFDGNEISGTPTSASAAALNVDVTGVSATLRRLRLISSLAAPSVDQAIVQIGEGTQGILSDLLVADGTGGGIFLSASGTTCALVAGNLTVTGHPGAGVSMSEGCPLRIENSIVFGNSPNTNLFGGTPEISAETLVGVDPLFVDAPNGNFRLGPLSPAIDAGDQTFDSVGPFDADHGTRLVGLDVDLGALERGAIFADGFERGDRYAWSSFAP